MPGGGLASRADLAAVFRRYGLDLMKRDGRLWALCPLHGEKTPSCEVNLQKGLWHCFGCNEGGDAIDLVRKREKVSFPEALVILGIEDQRDGSGAYPARNTRREAPNPFTFHHGQTPAGSPEAPSFAGSPPPPAAMAPATDRAEDPAKEEEDRKAIEAARRLYHTCTPLEIPAGDLAEADFLSKTVREKTPAAWYCEARGIPAIIATISGARYCADFLRGGPALVFPVAYYDQGDEKARISAVQGRYLFPAPAGSDRPDKKTRGRLKGIFYTANGTQQEYVIVTEAPLDALSLAACGFPALALLGTHYPDWLPGAIGARRVYLATDNDGAGDGAAQKLCDALAANGGKVYRLKPDGVKDWNEYLCTHGPAVMEAAIIAAAFPDRVPCIPRPVVDLAPWLPAGALVILSDGTRATVQRYHGPDEEHLPAGFVEVETGDGQQGQVDCRYLRDGSGAALVPYSLLTWREKIMRGRGMLDNVTAPAVRAGGPESGETPAG